MKITTALAALARLPTVEVHKGLSLAINGK